MTQDADREFAIPETELSFTFSRSSGPGGQHVNKTSTRVTLRFDIGNSPSLSGEEKDLLKERLATRIDKRGILRLVTQKHRSQAANRKEAIERFGPLIRSALKTTRPRKPTRASKAAKERRLREKTRRSRIKS
ncbi:MAG TPA: alternative ribosome rescue aminoacyl-tRNA hydrolase ArfB, partial [Acidobacteriota bacterium]|nr:alternative ribosome rescue aminoacyl-tRNA hydrolase ArfB [Acidobacteriota bacterium]